MISTYQPASSTAPCRGIQLSSMPQLAEAISKQDDWTGTNDAAARRRAQTRLNTRAYRKRKALAKKEAEAEASGSATGTLVKSEPLVECWDNDQQSVSTVPASHLKQLYNAKTPLLPAKPRKGQQFKIVFPLSPDHLITLLQFNVLRALAVNRSLISGILATPLNCGEEEVIHTVPYPSKPQLLPPSLLPTALQQTVPHADWVDLFPCPDARDRLIRAAGSFDEDDLWADCIGGLYEGFPDDEVERRGIVAWSPPWETSGWEMSEGFLGKWGWLFDGLHRGACLEATNRWRVQRGEEPLVDDGCTTHATV
ncbi:Uu.00g094960.m01.CDS01 [Anthostomella pinea]|uniref:Uu.00g094960.m01.CDS01 n=1 Tax=Anthostomella pinea TaxID=933095 RepID=A0AAI8YKP4_9PEZI|nr:Uu.00g094960.m01.CDS01 [Anthostomella pinea]